MEYTVPAAVVCLTVATCQGVSAPLAHTCSANYSTAPPNTHIAIMTSRLKNPSRGDFGCAGFPYGLPCQHTRNRYTHP